jgi:hypothetical protein
MKQDTKSWNGSTATVFTGIAMVLASLLVAIVWPYVGALSTVGLVWGSLLICVGLWFNHLIARWARDHAFRLAQLEERRFEAELKRDLLEAVLRNGLPEGVSREWVEKMLHWDTTASVEFQNERRAA